nr:putative coat protein [Ipomoea batatas]
MTAYLKRKLYHSQQMSFVEVDDEVTQMVLIIVNACMVVLYAKLRSIYTKSQECATIYASRLTYTKECELTLPFAYVIENFGKYVPHDVTHNIIHVPSYLENTQNEGRSTQNWSSYIYESYIPFLKMLGIPVKSVNPQACDGSPLWSYKVGLPTSPYVIWPCTSNMLQYDSNKFPVIGNSGRIQSNLGGRHRTDNNSKYYGCSHLGLIADSSIAKWGIEGNKEDSTEKIGLKVMENGHHEA